MGKRNDLHPTGASWMDLAAMTAVCMVVLPFFALLFATFPYAYAWLRILVILLFFAAGWGVQGLICRLLRYTRPKEGGGYEVKRKYYRIGLALPVWGLAALALFFLPRVVDRLLYDISSHSLAFRYDADSVFPLMAGAVAAVLLLLGSAVRLYPYTRVLSMRSCMSYIALFLVGFMLGGGGISAFCLFVFAFCAALLFNQITLERELHTLSLSDIPRETRMGSMHAVLWLGGIFLGVCAVLTIIVGGGMMVGRMFFFMLLRGMFAGDGAASGQYHYETSEEIMGMLRRYMVRGGESPWLNYLLMVLFVLGVVAAVLWLLLRHNDAIRRALHALWLRIAELIEFLFGASTRIYYRAQDDGKEVSYRDVRRKLDLQHTAHIGAEAARMSWREFRGHLSGYSGDGEKLCYAYAVLAAVLREQPAFPLLRSDTPRRIAQKVRARGRHEELREITAVYEIIRYAERMPSAETVSRALAQTCTILQEYLS
ncbi:MAG: DUF4129 domain-containing protein [Clostridia bacterium]|nr:DUF4129 domain-containing protein [Clostridia bacterium]